MFLRIISYITQRAIWSWEGFSHVLTTERSIYQWVFANAVSTFAAFSLPLSVAERSLIIMGGIMIIAMECMNTAIERVVDDISEKKRDRAKQGRNAPSTCTSVFRPTRFFIHSGHFQRQPQRSARMRPGSPHGARP